MHDRSSPCAASPSSPPLPSSCDDDSDDDSDDDNDVEIDDGDDEDDRSAAGDSDDGSDSGSDDYGNADTEEEEEVDDDDEHNAGFRGDGTGQGRERSLRRAHGPRLSPAERKEQLIASVTRVLETTCVENHARLGVGDVAQRTGYRSACYPDGSNSLFFSLCRPAIGLKGYVARFVKFLAVSDAVFIVALVYLDRVRKREPVLGLTYLNVHRLLTCALTVAQKFLEDEPYGNSTMYKLGGIPSVLELNRLELEFLKRVDCRVHVDPQLYREYRRIVMLAP